MGVNNGKGNTSVHCRTGSLEISRFCGHQLIAMHCRTGSLEIEDLADAALPNVHCRTGSLEMIGGPF